MDEIKFYSTNNPWTNNGMIIMSQEMQRYYEDAVEVRYETDGVLLRSNTENNEITYYIAKTLQTLAAEGTYNFSTALKYLTIMKNLIQIINLLKIILQKREKLEEKQ